jgi:hypothetical protein
MVAKKDRHVAVYVAGRVVLDCFPGVAGICDWILGGATRVSSAQDETIVHIRDCRMEQEVPLSLAGGLMFLLRESGNTKCAQPIQTEICKTKATSNAAKSSVKRVTENACIIDGGLLPFFLL